MPTAERTDCADCAAVREAGGADGGLRFEAARGVARQQLDGFRPARRRRPIEVRAIIRVDQRGDLTAHDHGDGDADVFVAQGDEVERAAVITEERGVMHFGARALIDDALEIGNHVEGERDGAGIARRGVEAGERPALEVAAAHDEHGAARGLAGGFGGEDVEELRQRLSFVEAAERGDEAFHRGEHRLALDGLALVGLTFEGGVTLGLRGFAFGLGRIASAGRSRSAWAASRSA